MASAIQRRSSNSRRQNRFGADLAIGIGRCVPEDDNPYASYSRGYREGLLCRCEHKSRYELLVEIGHLPLGELPEGEVARRRGRRIPLRQSG
jgi:hypothetical protein